MLRKILSGFWRFITAARNATINIVFILIIVSIVAAIFTSSGPEVPDSAALVIRPTGDIVEQKRPVDPMTKFFAPEEQQDAETLLKDILEAISVAKTDARIKVLVLDLASMQSAPFSKLEEIGQALETFKTSGKPIYAYGRRYSQGQYYLAAFADKIFLDKNSHQIMGGVFLTGLGTYPTYFKSALDKLKVNLHVYKVGKFKSAVEPFLRNDMSPEAREANEAWLGELWQHYSDTVITQRGISATSFNRYTNHYDEALKAADSNPNQLALETKLVDELITRDEWNKRLKSEVGGDKHFDQIGMSEYLSLTRPPIVIPNPTATKIAVVTAKGIIYDGQQAPGDIGGDSVSELIRAAREDKTVKAIVFRIDSPGGSASASEQIRTELVAAQDQGIPVVVSMGSYAASGGYWVSTSANKIFALETTITGSIGVFATIPTFEQATEDLGIYSDGVGTTRLSSNYNPFKTMNPVLDSAIQQGVEHTYAHFLEIVATGRDMTTGAVDDIAQGRVWTAKAALKLGLIDAIGSEADAIESAATLADIENYEVLYIEKLLSTKEQLINDILNSQAAIATAIGDDVKAQFMAPELNIFNRISEQLLPFLKSSGEAGIYAQCLECTFTQ